VSIYVQSYLFRIIARAVIRHLYSLSVIGLEKSDRLPILITRRDHASETPRTLDYREEGEGRGDRQRCNARR